MASTSGNVSNSTTGTGYPYPNYLTLYWEISGTYSDHHTIHYWVQPKGGASGYYQQYYNTSAWLSGAASSTLFYNLSGTGYQDTSIKDGYFDVYHSGEASFTIRLGGGFGGAGAYTSADGTWTLPALVTPPSGLSISIVEKYKDGAKFNVKVDSWGSSSTSDRYFEASIMNHGAPYGSPYAYKHGTHGINAGVTEAITVTNSTKESASSLTIVPNTQYYYGAWASNQAGASSVNIIPGTFVTLPYELSAKSASVVDFHTIKVNYTTKADGGKLTKRIQYSLNNSTWVNGATVASSSATSGSFNVTGLTPGTQYTIYLRVTTDSGSTASGSVSARTKSACKIIRGNSVIEAIPYIIKPNGTKKELTIRTIR